jgi:gamma-glutamyl-gamma-aminobutyraldehyde dehydrogenase/4-guanidinobutyraldehyde dehydrogenase/NAD-dependent aldehyde dehydrogenase
MKRVSLECGGKSAFVVLDSCKDLSQAAQSLAAGIFLNQGQTCSAPSRLIAEKGIAEPILELVKQELEKYQPTNPLLNACRVGALASERQLEGILQYVTVAKSEGAKLFAGGNPVEPVKGGAYFSPMTIAQEEIFGPVLSVITVANIAEAIHVANDSKYGLSAAVWSQDIDVALSAARKIQAGTVHINSYGEDDLTAPFGGFKQSGTGAKEKSLDAISAYSQQKTTWIKLNEKALG